MKSSLVIFINISFLLLFVGCDTGTNGNGETDLAFIGSNFQITDIQAYTETANPLDASANYEFTNYDYTALQNEGTLLSVGLNKATIIAEKVSFNFGTPSVAIFPMNPGQLVFTPSGIKMFMFLCLRTSDNKQLYHAKAQKQFIMYIYVDRDGIIKGTSQNEVQWDLNLKTGWNSAFADLNNKESPEQAPGY